MRGRLHDRDVDALADEILGHLKPDEPRPDHDRGCRRDVDVGGEASGIFDSAQRADPVVSGNRRAYRSRPHALHQLVVADSTVLARQHRTSPNRVRRPIDRDHFFIDPDIEAEPIKELLRGLERQILFLLDEPADKVWEAAVQKKRTRHAQSVRAR